MWAHWIHTRLRVNTVYACGASGEIGPFILSKTINFRDFHISMKTLYHILSIGFLFSSKDLAYNDVSALSGTRIYNRHYISMLVDAIW